MEVNGQHHAPALPPGERTTGTPQIRGFFGATAGLEAVVTRKNYIFFRLHRESNPGRTALGLLTVLTELSEGHVE
jgi:hypothetical protein